MSASSPSSSTPHAPRRPRVDKENASPRHHRQQHNDDDAFLNEMLSWCGSSGSKGSACTATHAVHVNNNNNNNNNNNTMHTPQKLATHTRDVNVSPCAAAHVDGASTTYTDAPHDDDDDDKAMHNTAQTTTTTTITTTTTTSASDNSCRACHDDDTDATSACVLPLPDELHARLYAHQRDGVQWLYTQHCRARACLLADEMGLGKTIQVCALLGCLYARGEARTTIIVAPTSLLALWQSALQSWAMLASPVVEVVQRGSSAQRAARWRRLTHGVPCVLLTSYGVLRRDVQAMRCAVADYVVYDEVQLVKDARTRVAASARVLCARHKVGLTGTPLMNSFADLWAVFQCLDDSLHLPATRNSNNNGNNNSNDASPASFARVNATLMRGNERGATAAVRRDAAVALAQLRALLAPHMLRREKRQLGDAVVSSNKHDVVVWVVLSDVQQRQYAACLTARPALTTTTMRDDDDDDNDNNDDNDTQQQLVHAHGAQALLLLTTLQQICSHPWLCLTDAAFRDALTRPFVAPCDDVGDVCSSTKLRVCMALLTRSVNAGHKVLVFARSRRLLQLLEVWLRQWWLPYSRLDGDTNAAQRQCVVDAFNRDAAVRVCLLTTQVGGVGLTFTAASCVVLLEPSWNASCDAQAIDRVHRIGQQHRDVLVYRIVTCGTVEETIYRNQIFKSMAAAQATAMARHATTTHDDNNDDNDDATTLFRYFTRTQLRRMFVLGDLQRSATARQLRMLHPTSTLPAAVAAMTCDVPHIADVSNHGCVLHERVATTATAAAAYDDDDDNDDNDDDAVSARCASTSTRSRRSHSPHATRPAGDDDDDDTLTMTTVLQPQPRQRQRQRSSAAATTTTTSSTTSSTKAEGDACARVRRPAQLLRADNDAREHVRAHELQCIEACVHDVHDDEDNDDDAVVTRMSSSMSSLRECVEPPDADNDDDDR